MSTKNRYNIIPVERNKYNVVSPGNETTLKVGKAAQPFKTIAQPPKQPIAPQTTGGISAIDKARQTGSQNITPAQVVAPQKQEYKQAKFITGTPEPVGFNQQMQTAKSTPVSIDQGAPDEKSVLSGFMDSMKEYDSGDTPFYGSGKEAVENIKVAIAFDKFEKGTADEKDKEIMNNYQAKQESLAKKRENMGYNVGETIKSSGRFMLELGISAVTEFFTGGVAPTGDAMILNQAAKLGSKKALQKFIKDKAFRATITTAVKNTVKKESIILAKQFAFTAPTNVTLGTAERMIGRVDTNTGEILEQGQKIDEAIVNSLTNHAVELLTERGGGVTGKILSKLATPVKKIATKTAIFQAFKKALPVATDSQITKVLNMTGWNGPLSEFWEERDADAFNHALYSVGLGDQEFTGLTMDQVATELIAFSIMGGGVKVISSKPFARDVKEFIKEPKIGLGIKDVSEKTPSVVEMAKQTNQQISQELKQKITEESFLSNSLKLEQAKNKASKFILADATPESTITVYMAGKNPIQSNNFVTLNKKQAEDYANKREGAKMFEKDVKLKELADYGGTSTEFVYRAKETPTMDEVAPFGDSPIDMAQQSSQTAVQNLRPDIAETIEPLQAVVGGDRNTPINERVRWIDYLRTPWKVFDRMGIRPAYEKLLKGYEGYVQELPKNIDLITSWSKQVGKESNEKIFRFLDGEKIQLDQTEAKVAGQIKTYLAWWADRLGMSKDNRISEYITHIFPFKKGGEIPEEIAHLIRKKIPGSVYNPFLLQRQGAEGYVRDTWKALDAYTKRATRKANMDPALNELKLASAKLTDTSQLDYLNNYVGKVNLRPSALDSSIDNHIKEKVGYLFGARPTASISRAMRKMIARAKIGGSVTSFAKNLTQGVNTFAELGTKYVTKGYIDLVKFGGKELKQEGVLIAPFIEDRTYSAVKKAAEKFDNVLFLNMSASELVNRGAAYYGAKAKFLDGKITPKEFKNELGEEMPANYVPTMEDAIRYGKKVSSKTQFLFGPLDTPVALNSDLAKMAVQFQTFGLKQAEFVGQMVGKKEWLKLVRYMLSSMLLFHFIGSAFGMKWDDSFKTLRWGMPPAIQFLIDLWNSGVMGKDKYGNILDTEQRAKAVGKSLFTNVVPAGSQIKRTVEGVGTVSGGAGRSPSGKFQYKVEDTPINYAKGALFGKYNLPESKAYYKKRDDKARGKKSKSSSNRYNPI